LESLGFLDQVDVNELAA